MTSEPNENAIARALSMAAADGINPKIIAHDAQILPCILSLVDSSVLPRQALITNETGQTLSLTLVDRRLTAIEGSPVDLSEVAIRLEEFAGQSQNITASWENIPLPSTPSASGVSSSELAATLGISLEVPQSPLENLTDLAGEDLLAWRAPDEGWSLESPLAESMLPAADALLQTVKADPISDKMLVLPLRPDGLLALTDTSEGRFAVLLSRSALRFARCLWDPLPTSTS